MIIRNYTNGTVGACVCADASRRLIRITYVDRDVTILGVETRRFKDALPATLWLVELATWLAKHNFTLMTEPVTPS